jgi:hypothetical protein
MFYFVLEQSYKQDGNCHGQLVFLASEMDGNFHINTASELIQCGDGTGPIPHKNCGLPVSYQ